MKRKLVLAVVSVILVAAVPATYSVIQTVKSPPRLFRRNAELKASGYYMAEFEFKMMAALCHLNDGAYWSAYRTLSRIDHEMRTLEGLPRIHGADSPEKLIAFMLDRQNRGTGAFMDSRYPFWTYVGPTANALEYLDTLSRQTGHPVKLKHRLKFLDEIADPKRLRTSLDAMLYFREFWADKFEGPSPFVLVSELSPTSIDLFERVGGYRFSEEWKGALRDWFYETQDPTTGFWGSRIGNKDRWRQALDIDSTSHILKHFLGDRGEPRDPKYRLRYSEALARTLLEQAGGPVPDDSDAQHEWSLRQLHAAKIIARWLWPALSEPLRQQALRAMPVWLDQRFSMYRPDEGGFTVDAFSNRADIDATNTAISFLRLVGAVPGTWERDRLRGPALATGPTKAPPVVLRPGEAVPGLPASPAANSVRVYRESVPPEESWDDSTLLWICYPTQTRVLDVMDLRQRLPRFLNADGGEYGNWSSKAGVTRQTPGAQQGNSRNPGGARMAGSGANRFGEPDRCPLFCRRPGRLPFPHQQHYQKYR